MAVKYPVVLADAVAGVMFEELQSADALGGGTGGGDGVFDTLKVGAGPNFLIQSHALGASIATSLTTDVFNVQGGIQVISGYIYFNTGPYASFPATFTTALLYGSSVLGDTFPNTEAGGAVIQSRGSGAARDICFVTGTVTPVVRAKVNRTGQFDVGIGGTTPLAQLEVADAAVLAGENLTNGALTSGTSWTQTGDMALTANAATYTHSSGVGTLQQASGTLAIAGKKSRLYALTYTVSGVSGTTPVASITSAFAIATQRIPVSANGTYTVIFRSALVPGNFVISVTSSVAGAFTIDTLSLKELAGGTGVKTSGFIQSGGDEAVKTQFDKAANTTLADIPDLAKNVQAGKKYKYRFFGMVAADATGGSKFAIAGTATATDNRYITKCINLSATPPVLLYGGTQTALTGVSNGGAGGTVHMVEIEGTILVNAGGTIVPQFAQNAASGTSSVQVGSSFEVKEIQLS